MTLKVSIVVGNPKPRSRTLQVATALVEHLLRPGTYDRTVIDLADLADELFVWPSERLATLAAEVAESDLVVFASPTYKATYTAVLKAFLDRYSAGGLSGVVAIPVLTAAGATHAMAPTFPLAPLLAELGAVVPGRGLSFDVGEIERIDEIVDAAAAEYRANIARIAGLAASTRP